MPLLAPPPLKRLLMSSDTRANHINTSHTQHAIQSTRHAVQSPLIQNGVLFVHNNFNAKCELLEQVYRDVHTIIIEDLTTTEIESGKKLLWILNLATYASTIKTIIIRNSANILFYPFFALSYRLLYLEDLHIHDIQFNVEASVILPYINYICPQLKCLSIGISMAPSRQFPIDLINGINAFDKLGMLSTCTTPTIMFSNLLCLKIVNCRWISSRLLFAIADCFPLLKELRFSCCSMPPSETLSGGQDARDLGICNLSIMKLDVLELSLSQYNIEDLDLLTLLPPTKLILNGSARINDAGTVAQLLNNSLIKTLKFSSIGNEARAKETLERLSSRHNLSLVNQ